MKNEKIIRAFNNIDDSIIENADIKKVKTKKNRFIKWCSAAVAACLVLGCTFMVTTVLNNEAKTHVVIEVDGVIKGREDSGYSGGKSIYESADIRSESIRTEPDKKVSVDDFSTCDEGVPGNYSEKAGTLTASEYKDVNNLANWKTLINDNKWYEIAQARSIYMLDIVTVKVTNDGNAVYNATVELYNGENKIYSARSDINGYAYLVYNIKNNKEKPTSVKVNGEDFELGGKTEIEAAITGSLREIKKLDLMLMIDTTGSMGDELRYITAELKDVVERINAKNQTIAIRTSVNFYRDETDEYVVKYYAFRNDIDECVTLLSQQSANGGGDFPEAVHTALDNAVNGHEWDDEAVKICFLVLDAPPHSESEVQGVNESLIKSMTKAAELGIRIIPVVASGADKDTEYLCRSFAVATGGTFIYLTDDSGIGNSHLKPEVTEENVEYLNECMIRVVCEYCGLEYVAPKTNQQ